MPSGRRLVGLCIPRRRRTAAQPSAARGPLSRTGEGGCQWVSKRLCFVCLFFFPCFVVLGSCFCFLCLCCADCHMPFAFARQPLNAWELARALARLPLGPTHIRKGEPGRQTGRRTRIGKQPCTRALAIAPGLADTPPSPACVCACIDPRARFAQQQCRAGGGGGSKGVWAGWLVCPLVLVPLWTAALYWGAGRRRGGPWLRGAQTNSVDLYALNVPDQFTPFLFPTSNTQLSLLLPAPSCPRLFFLVSINHLIRIQSFDTRRHNRTAFS